MGNLVARLRELFSSERKLEMCLVGLENSGKTTLLNVLSVGHPIETFPTVGLNVKMVRKQGVQLKVWDLGGQERFRSEWGRYTQGCDCIIYCVDSSDFQRTELAKRELHKLLEDKALHGLPMLVCLNKIDLEPHMSKEECVEFLNLQALRDNPWLVIPISALRQININEVVDWLVKNSHS
ncbi:putative ADP-ribosylation factor-like protein [Trypanosoma cruzi]|uniref:Putative ADP-ribosylation factor-like protein n=1 Tax=Trypanosoma cruzi TaxID=5693 RepID=A0A2V2X1Y0_TRYCR|nr:putative ADP-ribosylation factor-like protein [Trypanosoma cruzi]PWV14787.1 putative ADP-ribosylation factor-like protein [Trypanosoma cruzi]RNC33038.1 ADP-ribosylation factor-like protein [Trypanosoma cruzi]